MDHPNDRPGEEGSNFSPDNGSPGAAAAGSIDQIRDIIFGSQMKAYERRFHLLEEHSRQRIEELHAEVGRRLEAIEALTRREFDAHDERLKNEQSSRGDAVQALSHQIGEAVRELSGSIASQAEKQANATQDLLRQLSDLSQRLSEEIQRTHAESSQRLDQSVRQLDDSKVARRALAELLLDMAARLSGEPAAPHDPGTDHLRHD